MTAALALSVAWTPVAARAVDAPTTMEAAAPATEPAEDSAEAVATEASGDIADGRFYNKAGATCADYDAAWAECRAIARGAKTPTGSVPITYYNPAGVSPLTGAAAGAVSGLIGGLIAGAIAKAKARRDNRRSCLLVNGWRLIDVDAAEKARIAAMSEAQGDGYFDEVVGAPEVKGKRVRSWNNNFAAPQLALGGKK
ncbi:MAG: hypothetical protein AVDCRST_MAG39-414 [uncultured Sphingomonadaceae bacterium]|uniref:Glycine zipper domain-containing protein n=1 Tax=uncultured Sphingomonadaceae bacterium TaxID=169976 RepID=A0A6J4S5N5_9SPHN|nr:MAG: hypothetical protein AVDCRST_MAG39-414 [uncultured Sphingomonadaceae bacterium]